MTSSSQRPLSLRDMLANMVGHHQCGNERQPKHPEPGQDIGMLDKFTIIRLRFAATDLPRECLVED